MENDVTIVILSYNTKDITKICLEKALISARYCEKKLKNKVSIIVVDNGSADGSVEMIKTFPVELIALPTNTGAARGYNEGMKKTNTPFLLLINNDTYLDKETVFETLSYAVKNNRDVVSGRLLYEHRKRGAFGGYVPTPFKIIRWALGIDWLPLPMQRMYIKDLSTFNKEFKIGWIPTCFMFLTRQVYEKTKGHDERIFFYMDDVEWCKRINDAGFSIWYTPEFEIIHLGGKSTRDKWNKVKVLQHQVDGILFYVKKHYPKNLFIIICSLWLGFRLRSFIYACIGKKDDTYAYKNVLISTKSPA